MPKHGVLLSAELITVSAISELFIYTEHFLSLEVATHGLGFVSGS